MIKNLKNLIWEPSALFNDLKEKPTWLLPFIIICLIGVTLAFILHPFQIKLLLANIPKDIPEESATFMLHRVNKSKYIGYSLIPLVTLLRLAIFSGLILLGSYLFSDNLKYKQVFSIVSWSNIILILGGILNVIIIYLEGVNSINDPTDLATIGLSMFFNADSIDIVWFTLLSEISVFSVWFIILVSMGVKIIGRITTSKSAFISIFVWFIVTGFKVGMVALGSRFSI